MGIRESAACGKPNRRSKRIELEVAENGEGERGLGDDRTHRLE